MKILWTLTTESPTYAVGLFPSKETAEMFREREGLPRDTFPTPVICDGDVLK